MRLVRRLRLPSNAMVDTSLVTTHVRAAVKVPRRGAAGPLLTAIVVTAIAPARGAAEEPEEAPEIVEETIVVTGTRLETPLAASPVVTEVIDRARIEEAGAATAADALAMRPGLWLDRTIGGTLYTTEYSYDLADNQLNDVFVRFKALADRKKEVYDDDLVALVQDQGTHAANDRIQVKRLRVVCGTEGPQTAELTLVIDGVERSVEATGDGPVDATFQAVKALAPNTARLALYQVHAVTEGTDAQATVSVRLEEDGKIVTGQSADTDTVVASARAYVNALNKLLVRRLKTAPSAVSA